VEKAPGSTIPIFLQIDYSVNNQQHINLTELVRQSIFTSGLSQIALDTDFGNVTRYSKATNLTETVADWIGIPKVYMEGTTLKIVGKFKEKGYLYAIIDEGTAEIDLNKRA
jgi:hypothetical protein